MSGTFAPRPGAAPYPAMVRAQAAMEARLLLRNGEQVLLAIVIPVLALVASVYGSQRLGVRLSGRAVDLFTPGVLALAILSTAFTSTAIATGFERRYGVLKRLGASPLPRSGLLLGKVLVLLAMQLLQFVLLTAVALLLGWRPALSPAALGAALLCWLLGTAAFAALGLLLAGTLRAEATLATANLVFLLLMAGGAVVLPSSAYGGFASLARLLPSGALGDGLRAALIDGVVDTRALLVLTAWAVLAGALTARTFRWE